MKQFIVLAVTATLLGLALASGYNDHSDGYSSHGSRYGSYGRRGYGYGSYYKRCPKLEDPENGSVKFYSTKPGSKAIHSCDEGYVLTGVEVRICGKDGVWSDEAPTCEPVDCGDPDPADPNGSVDFTTTTFESIAVYSCNEGYKLDETQEGSAVVACLATKEWSDTAPICKPVKCGNPPLPDVNGQVQFGETTFQSEATYTCNEGYNSPGGVEFIVLTCESDSNWSDVAPDCAPVDCGSPPPPNANGIVSVGATTFRHVAIYDCVDGYLFDDSAGGSQTIYCLSTGLWSGMPPLHARIDCGYLDVPRNGEINYNVDTKLGSDAEFSCNRGFRRVGADSRKCETDGNWSGESPICERIQCPKLEAPNGGRVIVSGYYVDDYAIYRCGYGFALTGDKRRVCQEDGTWSGEEPKCEYQDKYGYDHHDGYGDGYGSRPSYGGRYNDKKDY